MEKLGK